MEKLSVSEFEQKLKSSEKPVLIDFYADWCGPCKMIAPIISELNKKYAEKLTVIKVNIDAQRALAGKFDIMSVPTVVLMKDGQVVDKSIGAMPMRHYETMIEKAM